MIKNGQYRLWTQKTNDYNTVFEFESELWCIEITQKSQIEMSKSTFTHCNRDQISKNRLVLTPFN